MRKKLVHQSLPFFTTKLLIISHEILNSIEGQKDVMLYFSYQKKGFYLNTTQRLSWLSVIALDWELRSKFVCSIPGHAKKISVQIAKKVNKAILSQSKSNMQQPTSKMLDSFKGVGLTLTSVKSILHKIIIIRMVPPEYNTLTKFSRLFLCIYIWHVFKEGSVLIIQLGQIVCLCHSWSLSEKISYSKKIQISP